MICNLFCLGMQHLLSHILLDSPDVLILIYCDNIFLFGTPTKIAELYPRLKAALAVGNLKLSPTKQHFFSPSPLTDTSLLTNLGIKECEGVSVLGGPVGPTVFIEEFLDRFFFKYDKSINSLCPLIHYHPHEALTLFTKCVLPSSNHIFRCVPTSILQNANFLKNIKDRDKAFLLQLLRRPSLYPNQADRDALRWALVHQPLRNAGLGIRNPEVIAPQAYLASWSACVKTALDKDSPFRDMLVDTLNSINTYQFSSLNFVIVLVTPRRGKSKCHYCRTNSAGRQ